MDKRTKDRIAHRRQLANLELSPAEIAGLLWFNRFDYQGPVDDWTFTRLLAFELITLKNYRPIITSNAKIYTHNNKLFHRAFMSMGIMSIPSLLRDETIRLSEKAFPNAVHPVPPKVISALQEPSELSEVRPPPQEVRIPSGSDAGSPIPDSDSARLG